MIPSERLDNFLIFATMVVARRVASTIPIKNRFKLKSVIQQQHRANVFKTFVAIMEIRHMEPWLPLELDWAPSDKSVICSIVGCATGSVRIDENGARHPNKCMIWDFYCNTKNEVIEDYGLTLQDRYEVEYAKGYRLGRIQAARKIIIKLLRHYGKPSKRLIHKINHEVDCRILDRIIGLLAKPSDTAEAVETLEGIYDTLAPAEEHEYDEDHDGG